MRPKITVLFTSAGRRVELLRTFRADAAALDVELRILACDLDDRWSAACQDADHSFAVPACLDTDYVNIILDNSVRERVDLVIPTIDPELLPLTAHRDEFSAHQIDLITSSPSFIEIARDKYLTVERLAELGLKVPRTGSPEEVRRDVSSWEWPTIAKPRDGSASVGFTLLQSAKDLAALDTSRQWVVQERLSGTEYTVNVLLDSDGKVVVAVPHERCRIRAGEVEKGITVCEPDLLALAERIASSLPGGRGPICFQAFVSPHTAPSIFEINARFGGGYPLCHAAGAKFGKWLIANRLGLSLPNLTQWCKGLRMLRYDAAIFTNFEGGRALIDAVLVLDLDDTLYLERDYVRSGLIAVEHSIQQRFHVTGFAETAWAMFQQGRRGNIFNLALEVLKIPATEREVSVLVNIYRNHSPSITLSPDSERLLARLPQTIATVLISDGPLSSQMAKIQALGLENRIHNIFCTDRWGREYWKPNQRAYKECERIAPHLTSRHFVYIADNPAKDFIAPMAMGWWIIRISRLGGLHATATTSSSAVHRHIVDLDAIRPRRLICGNCP